MCPDPFPCANENGCGAAPPEIDCLLGTGERGFDCRFVVMNRQCLLERIPVI